jgi:hypothetical protein
MIHLRYLIERVGIPFDKSENLVIHIVGFDCCIDTVVFFCLVCVSVKQYCSAYVMCLV